MKEVPKHIRIWKGAVIMYDNNGYSNDYLNGTGTTADGDGSQKNQTESGAQGSTALAQGSSSYGSSSYGSTSAQGNSPYNSASSYGRTYGGDGYQNSNTAGGYGTYANQNQNNYQNHYRSSYQYGNTYPNDYAQMSQKKEEKKGKKEKKAGGSYWKKALAAVSFGLFFGLFAGLGFLIVETVSGNSFLVSKGEAAGITAITETPSGTEEALSGAAQTEKEIKNGLVKETDVITTVVSDVSDVVTEVMPSIVAINNHYTETMSYFGQSMTSEADASGSGIIVGENDAELLIVTNFHVIDGADKLTVQFVEGSEAEAFVKGMDSDMDLAVIAVPLANVQSSTLQQIAVATLGDSDSLTVGEPAIAIGNSLGYGQSVTTGVISALNRSIELSDGTNGTFIQTDAAINPGNSGGALLNVKGEVIGINSNKIGGSVVEGMGYAIPISAANPIIAELMLKETKSKVAEEERGYLGISGISVTEEVSQTYGMPEGVYIAQVYENTAAEAAGLMKGDIITAFDGDKISSMDELQRELEFYAKGDTVEITVMTVGEGGYRSRTVTLTLGNRVQ